MNQICLHSYVSINTSTSHIHNKYHAIEIKNDTMNKQKCDYEKDRLHSEFDSMNIVGNSVPCIMAVYAS